MKSKFAIKTSIIVIGAIVAWLTGDVLNLSEPIRKIMMAAAATLVFLPGLVDPFMVQLKYKYKIPRKASPARTEFISSLVLSGVSLALGLFIAIIIISSILHFT